jgi:hypothetical protein
VNMNSKNPDVTDEDIGRRTVEIRRARAVDRAIERLRKGLGTSWKQLTTRDVEKLRWGLGELWGYIPHAQWDDLRFSSLRLYDAKELLELCTELAGTHTTTAVLDKMAERVLSGPQPEPEAEPEPE